MSPPDDSKKAEILVEVSIVCTCCVVSVESRGRLIVPLMKIDAVQKVDYTPIAITSWNVIYLETCSCFG